MATYDDVKYIVYSNSYGNWITTESDHGSNNTYSNFAKIIDALELAVKDGTIKAVSPEFMSKTLSIFLNSSDKNKYREYYKKLKDIPVIKTQEEVEQFNKERDEFMNKDNNYFNVKSFVRSKLVPVIDPTDVKYKNRSDFTEKSLELLASAKDEEYKQILKVVKNFDERISLGEPEVEVVADLIDEFNAEEEEEGPVIKEEEEGPVIEQQQPDDEEKRELLLQIATVFPDLSENTKNLLSKASLRRIKEWYDYKTNLVSADNNVNVFLDEEDDNTDDGMFGLRNNFTDSTILLNYNFEDFLALEKILEGQPKEVYENALKKILANPNEKLVFNEEFLTDVLQNQQTEETIFANTNSDQPDQPENVQTESNPEVSTAQPIVGTGADTEKLPYLKRYHTNSIQLYFNNSSYPSWDKTLEQNVMSMEISEAERIEIMEDIIAEYGKKIFIKARKSSTKEELNELIQLQFCVMRNLQLGPRSQTANVKLADLQKLQILANKPQQDQNPQQQNPQQNIQEAPKPQIIEPLSEVNSAQVQTFNEAKFIDDYSKMQMQKNLSNGPKLQYPNSAPKIYNEKTPKTVNYNGPPSGLDSKKKVVGFSSSKF